MAESSQAHLTNERRDQEERLRSLVKERPQNGKAMARLACLLAERANVLSNTNSPASKELKTEALEWAHRSIDVSPERPFGYLSMSLLEEDFSKRMHFLRKAIHHCQESDTHSFVKLSLMIRLLRDPRVYEKRNLSGKIGRASPQHPSRRPMDQGEELLYKQIKDGLDKFWTAKTQSKNSVEEIALAEYRLGLFFRKRLPVNISQERAKSHLLRAVEHLPANHENVALCHFWLGTLSHMKLDRCPAAYVINLYSTFAETFDKLLVEKLEYQTPDLLRKLVEKCTPNRRFNDGLDLGCGTGISGMAFRDLVHGKLFGIDLSPAMIAKARKRRCYDSLEVHDVVAFLGKQEASQFDFVCACDVLVYLGDLKDVMIGVYQVLSPRGIFAFSTELLEGGEDGDDYILHECARFSHSRFYIEGLAKEARFEIVRLEVSTLRKNQGKDVVGLLVVVQKVD